MTPSASTTVPAPLSNSTTQTIWQVQVAGCLFQCQGITQVQDAGQQNVTLQGVAGGSLPSAGGSLSSAAPGTAAPGPAGGSLSSAPGTAAPGPAAVSQISSTITQTQLGCRLHCFDGGTISSPPGGPGAGPLPPGLAALQQLLSNPAVLQQLLADPAGLQQLLSGGGGLGRLLAVLTPGQQLVSWVVPVATPAADPVPGAEQNSVGQTAYQTQIGGPGTAAQTQIALQVNATVQLGSPPAAPASGGDGGDATGVNQAMQGILQLQVGCIFYCVGTQQNQQASQSDVLIEASGTGAGATVTVVNSVVMRIWQLQIGCLFWCNGTVELQSAVGSATTVTLPQTVPATPGPGGGSSSSGAAADPPSPPPAHNPPASARVRPWISAAHPRRATSPRRRRPRLVRLRAWRRTAAARCWRLSP